MEEERVLLVEENLGWLTQMSFQFLTYQTKLGLSGFFFLKNEAEGLWHNTDTLEEFRMHVLVLKC